MAKAASRKNAAPQINTTGKTRLLVVDDHPIVRRGLIAMIHQDPNLQVCAEAENYHEALDAVKTHQPDLAVIDLTLKDIGGLDLIKQLQVTHPDLPLLVLSMHDETIYAERALRAGARGYIMKQEGTERLTAAIHTVLRGDIYVSEKMAGRLLGQLVKGKTNPDASSVSRLTDRELEVFQLLGNGHSTRQIAERLCVSIKTIESHREHIKEKLALRNANELVQRATQWVMHEGAD